MRKHFSASRSRQRGLSFIGIILIGFIALAVFGIGGQAVPIFLEHQAIAKAANRAAKEGSTVAEVQNSFDRAGAIDNISSVKGKDLTIVKRGDKNIVSYKYSREIALAGPAYLVFRFEGQAK